MYIAEAQGCVRVVEPDGTIDTFAGQCGTRGSSGDGGDPRDALLVAPSAVAVDRDGYVYIADQGQVRVVRPGDPADNP